MATSKAARAALTTNHLKKSMAAATDIFSALEDEQPCGHFPLLELPRELRDEILEYAATDEIIDCRAWSHRCRPIVEINIRQLGTTRKMDACRHDRRLSPPMQGVFAMVIVNKQVREEIHAAFLRAMPHHVYVDVSGSTTVDNPVGFQPELFHSLAARIRRLYLKNAHARTDCYFRDLRDLSLGAGRWDALSRLLTSCSTLAELVVDLCTMSGHHGSKLTAKPLATMVKIAESLPALREYAVSTCTQGTYACRRQDQGWDDEDTIRTEGIHAAVAEDMRKELLDRMRIRPCRKDRNLH